MIIRCSSLSKIMTKPRKNGEVLSEGAKTYIRQLAKEDFYGYNSFVSSPAMEKGTEVEDDSIILYNNVFFTDYVKNTERITSELLTGECDIDTGVSIIDIKSAWSLETFPATVDEALQKSNAKDYEWQLRGYMMLYDRPKASVAYTMISTPDDLLKDWDNTEIHKVDHIAEQFRLTIIDYERDLAKEEEIKNQCKFAQEYYSDYIAELKNKNS